MATVLKVAAPTAIEYWDYLVRLVLDDISSPERESIVARYNEIREERMLKKKLSQTSIEELLPCLRQSMEEHSISFEPWVGVHSNPDIWVDLRNQEAAIAEYEEIAAGEEIWASIQKD